MPILQQVVLPPSTIQHIINRHINRVDHPTASKFIMERDDVFQEIEDLLNETIESDGENGIDQTVPDPKTGKLRLIVLRRIFDRPIGTDRTQMVTCLTVLIHPYPPDGGRPKIATAYPTDVNRYHNRVPRPEYRYGPEGRAPIPIFDFSKEEEEEEEGEEEYFFDITEDDYPEASKKEENWDLDD